MGIKCCLNCKEDKTRFPGNCHDHCEIYISEIEEYNRFKDKVRTAKFLNHLLEKRVTKKKGKRNFNRSRWK